MERQKAEGPAEQQGGKGIVEAAARLERVDHGVRIAPAAPGDETVPQVGKIGNAGRGQGGVRLGNVSRRQSAGAGEYET